MTEEQVKEFLKYLDDYITKGEFLIVSRLGGYDSKNTLSVIKNIRDFFKKLAKVEGK